MVGNSAARLTCEFQRTEWRRHASEHETRGTKKHPRFPQFGALLAPAMSLGGLLRLMTDSSMMITRHTPGSTPREDTLISFKRELDPMERVSEILFGLIMVLTFTCSFSVIRAGREEVREMLIGALGCNLAWAITDAVFYLMSRLSEQGQGLVALRALRATNDPAEAHQIIGSALPPLLASVLPQTEYEIMQQKVNELPELPEHPRLAKEDWLAAGRVFLLVFLSTLPVAIPFVFIRQAALALRLSNVVGIAMLFGCGYAFGRFSGFRPWRVGVLMVLVGVLLAGLTIALGG